MLGQGAGHSDERAALHACFLAAATGPALLMMAPALYISTPGAAGFAPVPALDLALHPGDSPHPPPPPPPSTPLCHDYHC